MKFKRKTDTPEPRPIIQHVIPAGAVGMVEGGFTLGGPDVLAVLWLIGDALDFASTTALPGFTAWLEAKYEPDGPCPCGCGNPIGQIYTPKLARNMQHVADHVRQGMATIQAAQKG